MDVSPAWHRDAPAPPVRVVHLGLGAFARAHLLTYTQDADAQLPPEQRWGVAGFTGRSPRAAADLAAQDGRYTVVERGPDGDTMRVVDALVEVHDGADGARWRSLLSRPAVGVLSLTVTEAGYRRTSTGALDLEDADVRDDVALLRRLVADGDGHGTAPAATTAPGRVLDGLRARRAAGGGPLAVVGLDNLPDNGDALRRVVLELADAVDRDLARWLQVHVAFVSSMVDRITPATTPADRAAVELATGRADRAPVVTEPFREWVLSGRFPAGRPAWDAAGARFVADLAPYEHRKLWLLNAGHSLLAYAGPPRGAATVAEAFADPALRDRLEELWREACDVLPLIPTELDDALADLRERFANARIEHRLEQIARDGSQKLPVRVLDVARARRAAGLPVGDAGAAVLADWALHLRAGGAATDPGAADLAARLGAADPEATAALVVHALAPDLADDTALLAAVAGAVADRHALTSS
ncbi:mannitol dehydrogenase family protein [Cellulomonas sp. Sa3CUA2]|uniref:Mannitol-1-phosphate 5-dehydrogenase n=1 Tax=Cellulomonas avistercoris TaxID=2762242 RepID=A0ABR8QFS6_9CELL|nr:mannitol dehydrogenase family protein [Cellulomonas avistercoris]MBD7919278.1 mannitol dehydrogenase family protein [Cellulomonas avistercoris]